MIRKCYPFLIMLMVSALSRGQHANVQHFVVGVSTGKTINNGNGGSESSVSSVGDPSVFGINSWNVYAWNSSGSDSWDVNYAGYYVDSALSMNTYSSWDPNGSPSFAT